MMRFIGRRSEPSIAAVLLACLAMASPVGAATVVVDTVADGLIPDGNCSLREAIQAANTDSSVDGCPAGSGADTIQLPAGTYPLTIGGGGDDLNVTGDLDIRSDVTLAGTGASPSTIDAAGLHDRVLHVKPPNGTPPLGPAANITVTLRNLRLVNGSLNSPGGGGAKVEDLGGDEYVTLVVEDCAFDGNSALVGGGMTLENAGEVTIRRSSFRNNSAVLDGGGLTVFSPTLIEDSTFDSNTVASANPSQAGGGGILVNRPTTIRRSTISNNDAGGTGGGGIACQNADLLLENSTVSGNTSTGQGGGGIIQGLNGANDCTVTVDSSTIIDNTGVKGGGYYVNAGSVTVRNTIIAGNTTTGTGSDVQGNFTSAGYNLIGDGTESTGFSDPDDLVGTGGSPIGALLGALADNGGRTLTHEPAAGSPALDTGTCSLPEDQRRFARPAAIACDRGSVESGAMPAALCRPTPTSGCRLGATLKSSIGLKDNLLDDARDQFRWVWAKGAATDVADFADPVDGSASYRVCLYDSSSDPQPLMDAALPPGGTCGERPCWKQLGSFSAPKGFKYKNKAGPPDGLTDVKLQAGAAGRAKLLVKGRGASLAMPSLGLTLPVTVQLVIDDGVTTSCWQTQFTTFQKNATEQFKAKGP